MLVSFASYTSFLPCRSVHQLAYIQEAPRFASHMESFYLDISAVVPLDAS